MYIFTCLQQNNYLKNYSIILSILVSKNLAIEYSTTTYLHCSCTSIKLYVAPAGLATDSTVSVH